MEAVKTETQIFREIGQKLMSADAYNIINKLFENNEDKYIETQLNRFCNHKLEYFFILDVETQERMINILTGKI